MNETAKLLTYIIHLHRRGLPFPPRKEVAAQLGIAIPTIDAIISEHIAAGTLTAEYRFIENDDGVSRFAKRRERYLIPAQTRLEAFGQ
ncbi:MAG TPA: hypothetical protein VEW06_06365 [Xanthobacteraceae bacterium]|nr:hypothetical protein [Xanthobacteraceae bacterium]